MRLAGEVILSGAEEADEAGEVVVKVNEEAEAEELRNKPQVVKAPGLEQLKPK